MQIFKNILVSLDLTDMDDTLVKYSNFLAKTFRPDSITFIHVMETVEIPDELAEAFPDMDKPIAEIVKEEIQEKVDDLFDSSADVKRGVNVVVSHGSTTEGVVEFARKNKTDLALLGKKIGYDGEGGVARKIVGLIPSSVLLVSEISPQGIGKILVRMDFSAISAIALQTAREIAEATGSEVHCHHVYKLPLNYFPQQSPAEVQRLKKRLSDYVQSSYKDFLKKHKLKPGVPCTFSMDLHGEEAQIIYSQAVKTGADLILVGSKIKSQLANVILDSTSEKLAGANKSIPVMVVKDRKKSIGFLKALFD